MALTMLYIVISDDQVPFDPIQWRDTQNRRQMIDDLRRNVLTHGMPRHEVESLLGRDSSTIMGLNFTDSDLVYRIGNGPGVGTTTRYGSVHQVHGPTEYLLLTFNNKDQLVDWNIVSKR